MISKKILLLFTIGIFVNASVSNFEVIYESQNKSFPSRTYMFFPANFPLNWREAAELCENVPGAVLAKIPDHESESIMRFLLTNLGLKKTYWTRNRETISEIVYKKNLDNHERLSHLQEEKKRALSSSSEKAKKEEEEEEEEEKEEAGVILKCSYLHPTFGLRKQFCDHHIEGGAICAQKLKFERPHKDVCPPSPDRPWVLLRTEEGNVSSIISLKYCQSDNSVLEIKCNTERGWESNYCINKSIALKSKIFVKRHAKYLRTFFNKRKIHSSKRASKFYTRSHHKFNHQKESTSRIKPKKIHESFETSSQYKDISASEFFNNKHGVVTFDQKRFDKSTDQLERIKRSVINPPFLHRLQNNSNNENNIAKVEDFTPINDRQPQKLNGNSSNYINSQTTNKNQILTNGNPNYDDDYNDEENSQDLSFPEQILIGRFYPSNEFDDDDKISKLAEAIVDFINYNEKGLTNSSSFYFEQINDEDQAETKLNLSLTDNSTEQTNLENKTNTPSDSLVEAPQEHFLYIINNNKTKNATNNDKLQIKFFDMDSNQTATEDNLNESISLSTFQDTSDKKGLNSSETNLEYAQNFEKESTTDINNYHRVSKIDTEYVNNKALQSTEDYENENDFHSFSNQHYLTLESYFWSEKNPNNDSKTNDFQLSSTEEAYEFDSDKLDKNLKEENSTDFIIINNNKENLKDKNISTKYLFSTEKPLVINANETPFHFTITEPKENYENINDSEADFTEKYEVFTNNSLRSFADELDTNNTVYKH